MATQDYSKASPFTARQGKYLSTVGPGRPQTIVFIGDSLTEQGGMISAAPQIKPYSPWTWAMNMLGQRFKVLSNAGIGGQTSTQILARFDTDVVAMNPGWVHILCGTNDMGNGTATAKANITEMLDRADAAGIRVILGTIPPRLPANYTGSVKVDTLELNRWIIATARVRANVVLVDYFAALADVLGQYRATTAGWNPTSDGVHLSATGGFVAGLALFNVLDKITEPYIPYIPWQGLGGNLIANPDFTGTANMVPTSWSAAGTASAAAVYSVVDRDGVPVSPWKQVVIANGGGALSLSANANVGNNGIAVGDQVIAFLDYDLSNLDQAAAAGTLGFFLRVKMWNGTAYTNTLAAMEDYNSPVVARKGTLFVPDFTIPVGTTTVTLEISAYGGGTYKIGRAGLYKSTTFD